MRRILLAGLVLAVLVSALAAASSIIALNPVWPVLLAAAVVLVPGGATLPRVGAFLAGAVAAWLGYLVRVTVLPDIAISPGLALAAAVLLVTVVAVATADRLPLWVGLAGIAAFAGVYEATYLADPTAFLSESPAAFTVVLLAGALGALAGLLAGAGFTRPVIEPADAAEEAHA